MAVAELLRHQQRRFPSPLRYPGGKGKVANFIRLLFLDNGLVGHEYVEPYAGGASVALGLLYDDYADHIHINDLDQSVHAFWWAVLNATDEFCKKISDTDLTVDEWQRQRDVQAAADPGPLELAFSTFVMNRANRSGIITGGIIGGRDQTGPYKLDARYNRPDLIGRIEKVARFRSRITLTCQDAVEFLDAWSGPSPVPAVVYLDPPYFKKGGDLYRNHYQPADHAEVAVRVRRLTVPWVVSYDAHPEILGLYDDFASFRYSLSYSAAARERGSEVMFFSPQVVMPDVPSPAGILDGTVSARLLAGAL